MTGDSVLAAPMGLRMPVVSSEPPELAALTTQAIRFDAKRGEKTADGGGGFEKREKGREQSRAMEKRKG